MAENLELEGNNPAALVLEIGSRVCRVGIGGEDLPRHVISTAVVKNKLQSEGVLKALERGDQFYDDKYEVNSAVERGIIVDWKAMEEIWRATFYDVMKVNPAGQPLLITEPILNPKANREKTTEILFETFNINHFYIINSIATSVYAVGKTCGVAVQVEEDCVTVCPLIDGYTCPYAVSSLQLGGEQVTQFLMQKAHERGYDVDLNSREALGKYEDLKRKHCFISKNFDLDLKRSREEFIYEVAISESMTIGEERFVATEILFTPSLYSNSFAEKQGISDMIIHSINRADVNYRKDFYGSIVVCGSSSLFPGMKERIEIDLKSKVASPLHSVINPMFWEKRENQVWIGGSILAALASFQTLWMTKDEYDETGPYTVHRKCYN